MRELKKNYTIYLLMILFVVIIISQFIAFKNYEIIDNGWQEKVISDLSNFTRPETAEITTSDTYQKGRITYISGYVYNVDYKGPFIAGYRKHVLFDRYENVALVIRTSENYIDEKSVASRSGTKVPLSFSIYKAYHNNEKLGLVVTRRLNIMNVLMILNLSVVVFFEFLRRKGNEQE